MEKVVLKKENGQVVVVEFNPEIKRIISETKHKCSNCVNCRADRCQKIEDLTKERIGKYDFITDGYQIINEDNQIENFTVSKCNNYLQDQDRKAKTLEERKKLKRAKEAIFMYYFNAGSVEEACLLQEEFLNYPSVDVEDEEAIEKDPYKNRRLILSRSRKPAKR